MKMSNIEVPTPQMEIISESAEHGRIFPRLYAFIEDEKFTPELEETLNTSLKINDPGQSDEDISVPVYYIQDIEEASESDVYIYFSPAHLEFDAIVPTPFITNELGIFPNTHVHKMRLPKSYLVLLRALYRFDGRAVINLCLESSGLRKPLIDKFTIESSPLFVISFPPEAMVNTWNKLSPELLNISVGLYAEDERSRTSGAPAVIRKAQRDLLIVLNAMAKSSVLESIVAFDKLEKLYETDEEGRWFAKGLEADYATSILRLVVLAYHQSASISPHDTSPEFGNSDAGESSEELDQEFAELMAFNEMDSSLKKIDEQDPHYRPSSQDQLGLLDPLIDGIPTTMLPIMEHLVNTSPEVMKIIRWNFMRTSVYQKAVNTYGVFNVMKAMIVVTAARFAKYFEDRGETPTMLPLIASLTSAQDRFPWEISAFKKSLSSYDINGFSELLQITPTRDEENENDPRNTVYLFPTLLHLAANVKNEGWTLGNVDARLQTLPRISDAPKVRALLACLLEPEQNDEQGAVEIKAAMTAMDSYDLRFLSHTVSILIPSLADYAAQDVPAEVGSEAWKTARNTYLDSFLESVSNSLTRLLHHTENHEG